MVSFSFNLTRILSIKFSQIFITLSFYSICLSRVCLRSSIVVEIFISFLVISIPRLFSAISPSRVLIIVSDFFISWRTLLYSTSKRVSFCSTLSDIRIHSFFWDSSSPSMRYSSCWYSSCITRKELTNSSMTLRVYSTVLLFCSLLSIWARSASLSWRSRSRSCCSWMTWWASCSISCWLICGKLSTCELLNSSMDSVNSVLILMSSSSDLLSVMFSSQSILFCCFISSISAEKSDYFCRNKEEDIDILLLQIRDLQKIPTIPNPNPNPQLTQQRPNTPNEEDIRKLNNHYINSMPKQIQCRSAVLPDISRNGCAPSRQAGVREKRRSCYCPTPPPCSCSSTQK